MKIRPIIFNPQMVRALLNGSKTQTRRIITPQPDEDGLAFWMPEKTWRDTSLREYKCPHGEPGDLLYVRENFAIGPDGTLYYAADDPLACAKWKPSIHIKREHSRITLLVKFIKVERLQNISEADAIAEGCRSVFDFEALWDSINADRGFGWNTNPWLWCESFEVIKRNVDEY